MFAIKLGVHAWYDRLKRKKKLPISLLSIVIIIIIAL